MAFASMLNEWGVGVILLLQRYPFLCQGWVDAFWIFLTTFGDPNFVFMLYVPLIYPFSKHTAQEFLIAGAISEYSNMVLKWIFMSDRPYWWVEESGLYTNETMPDLLQFEHTCETGPGNPSGHAMVTSCVWLVFLINVKRYSSSVVQFLLWVLYLAVVLFIALSRLYIAAHFPHQLVLGVFFGVIIAVWIVRRGRRVDFSECSRMAACLFTISSVVLLGARLLQVDLDWSIALAHRWCQDPSWVHMSTTPYTGLFRDLGALLGLGFAADKRRQSLMRHQHTTFMQKIVWAGLSVGFAVTTTFLVFKVTLKPLFYGLTFAQNFTIMFSAVFAIPYYTRNIKVEQ